MSSCQAVGRSSQVLTQVTRARARASHSEVRPCQGHRQPAQGSGKQAGAMFAPSGSGCWRTAKGGCGGLQEAETRRLGQERGGLSSARSLTGQGSR